MTDTREEPAQPAPALQASLVISAIRCTLTYVVFPFIAPLVGLVGLEPWIGLPIALVALVANVVSIRRFHANDHRYKWPVSALNVAIIGLVVVLIIRDLGKLL